MGDFTDDISIIEKANNEMLDYFNASYLGRLETVQALKTELFELEIKLEELEKTKNIYTYNTQSRKNIFSPIAAEASDSSKNREITEQIESLTMEKESLSVKLHTLQEELDILKRRLNVLSAAKASINAISGEASSTGEENFEFVDGLSSSEDNSLHGHNILMINTFDNAYLSTILSSKVKNVIVNDTKLINELSNRINPKDKRSVDILKKLRDDSYNTGYMLDSVLTRLDYDIDVSKPVWTLLDELVMSYREAHPECIIEANIQYADYDKSINNISSINLIKLLKIFFDNIFKHANANNVILRIYISDSLIDVYIKDNGKGIPADYCSASLWHSGIHRAKEIVYLLDGSLRISTPSEGGTLVRFSFPVKA